ncbi:hypothetical protein QTO34_016801 [Cnephaeus nilssonii]|uniref:Uncharacterized protein n=1 Tax=Cnephaeus nilssonii TaxID=3371016 RepID=A0AA40I2X6_CNENI|nr:hypothetical protein QTO34_016801 [Eptesicus nilssonii]
MDPYSQKQAMVLPACLLIKSSSPSSSQPHCSHCRTKASSLCHHASLPWVKRNHVDPAKATSPSLRLRRWRPFLRLPSLGLHSVEAGGGTPGGISAVEKIKMAVPSGRAHAAAPWGAWGNRHPGGVAGPMPPLPGVPGAIGTPGGVAGPMPPLPGVPGPIGIRGGVAGPMLPLPGVPGAIGTPGVVAGPIGTPGGRGRAPPAPPGGPGFDSPPGRAWPGPSRPSWGSGGRSATWGGMVRPLPPLPGVPGAEAFRALGTSGEPAQIAGNHWGSAPAILSKDVGCRRAQGHRPGPSPDPEKGRRRWPQPRPGSLAPNIDEKVDLHFIALVHVDGHLYELGHLSFAQGLFHVSSTCAVTWPQPLPSAWVQTSF